MKIAVPSQPNELFADRSYVLGLMFRDVCVVVVRRLQVDRYIYQIRRENEPFIGGLRLFWEYALSPEWREGVFSFNTMRM